MPDNTKTLLFNCITAWFDENISDYKSLDDDAWVSHVCNTLSISRDEYNEIMN